VGGCDNRASEPPLDLGNEKLVPSTVIRDQLTPLPPDVVVGEWVQLDGEDVRVGNECGLALKPEELVAFSRPHCTRAELGERHRKAPSATVLMLQPYRWAASPR
jgi:hypothetical protein